MKKIALMLITGGLLAAAGTAVTQPEDEHHGAMHAEVAPSMEDGRTLVHFPEPLRRHTLANMRDHLLALSEIQSALAEERFGRAAEIAEQRLGMSSLDDHNAHQVGRYMPAEMAAIGSAMHKAASRFAVIANDVAVTGEVGPALSALAAVTNQCVACHDGYRVQ